MMRRSVSLAVGAASGAVGAVCTWHCLSSSGTVPAAAPRTRSALPSTHRIFLPLYSLSAIAALLSVLAPIVVIWRAAYCLARTAGAHRVHRQYGEFADLFWWSGFNDGGYVDGIGPFVWVVWVAAVSVCMLMKFRAPIGGHQQDLIRSHAPSG